MKILVSFCVSKDKGYNARLQNKTSHAIHSHTHKQHHSNQNLPQNIHINTNYTVRINYLNSESVNIISKVNKEQHKKDRIFMSKHAHPWCLQRKDQPPNHLLPRFRWQCKLNVCVPILVACGMFNCNQLSLNYIDIQLEYCYVNCFEVSISITIIIVV